MIMQDRQFSGHDQRNYKDMERKKSIFCLYLARCCINAGENFKCRSLLTMQAKKHEYSKLDDARRTATV